MRIAQRYETDGKYEIAYRLYHRALSYEPRNVQAQQKLKLMAQQLSQPAPQPAQPQPATPSRVNAQELLAAMQARHPASSSPEAATESAAASPTIAKAAAEAEPVESAPVKALRPAATPAIAAKKQLLPAAVKKTTPSTTPAQPQTESSLTSASSSTATEEKLPTIRPAGRPGADTPETTVAQSSEPGDWWSDVFSEDLPSTEQVALTETPVVEAEEVAKPMVESPVEMASTDELVREALLGELGDTPTPATVDVREQLPTIAEPTDEEMPIVAEADEAEVPVAPETVAEADAAELAGTWSRTSLRRLCGELPGHLEMIVKQLDSDSRDVKVAALDDLGRMKEEAAPAALAIRAMLNDEDGHVQVAAAGALWEVERDSWDSVKTLRAGLKSDDPNLVQLSAYLLGKIGPEAMDAIEDLESLRDADRSLASMHAAEAITRIAPDQTRSVEVLVEGLGSADRQARWFSAVALGNVSAPHRPSVARALKFALHDDEPDVRAAAALSLGGLGSEGGIAIADLEYAALFDAPEVRDAAVTALACLRD